MSFGGRNAKQMGILNTLLMMHFAFLEIMKEQRSQRQTSGISSNELEDVGQARMIMFQPRRSCLRGFQEVLRMRLLVRPALEIAGYCLGTSASQTRCTLNSPEEFLKTPVLRPHPRTIKSQSRGLTPRCQYCLNITLENPSQAMLLCSGSTFLRAAQWSSHISAEESPGKVEKPRFPGPSPKSF